MSATGRPEREHRSPQGEGNSLSAKGRPERAPPPGLPRIVLRPARGWNALRLGELREYHEVVLVLVWRDIKVRYAQAVLGVAWAVLQPVATMIVMTIVFGRLARMPSDGLPYEAFALAGLLPWQLFQNGVQRASLSLVQNANLLTRVYFPRLSLPLAAVLGTLVDFLLAALVLAGLLAWYGWAPAPERLLWLPALTALAVLNALGIGLWLSALNVRFRDVQHTLPFLLQIALLASPVAYSASLVPEGIWRTLYGLNPMVGVIQGFRWALLGGPAPGSLLVLSAVTGSVLLVGGLYFFRRVEWGFADRL